MNLPEVGAEAGGMQVAPERLIERLTQRRMIAHDKEIGALTVIDADRNPAAIAADISSFLASTPVAA